MHSTYASKPRRAIKIVGTCVNYSLHRFNSRYKQVAIPTKPASGDIFNYQRCSSELSVEKQTNDTVSSAVPGANIIPLEKSAARIKMDDKKSKLQAIVALVTVLYKLKHFV